MKTRLFFIATILAACLAGAITAASTVTRFHLGIAKAPALIGSVLLFGFLVTRLYREIKGEREQVTGTIAISISAGFMSGVSTFIPAVVLPEYTLGIYLAIASNYVACFFMSRYVIRHYLPLQGAEKRP